MRGFKKMIQKKNWIAAVICLSFVSLGLPKPVQAEETNLVKGQVYHGFKLVEDNNIPELDSTSKVFKHEKSGANLIYLQNDDVNKVFSINFYTPPSDNTGVNHILEHSVLYGSEKYPVKSPLMQVMKQSVSNFANAFTSSDKTSFPFATTNGKDFKNIMGIYMDAVFRPNFRTDSKIFEQEGWRYELSSKDSALNYNGVVYNEMKGNYANPEMLLQNSILKSLFPDTLYKWEAGGDPDYIPQLTYEKALEVYNKNYHPSNSYIFVYGKVDILETLKFLDGEYLNKFNKKEVSINIPKQATFSKRQELSAEYPVTAGSDTKNKTYLSLNYAIDTKGNLDDIIGLQLLNYMLLGTDTSPLKASIIKNGFGSSVKGSLNTAVTQPVFQITVSGSNKEYKDQYSQYINTVLASIAQTGLDKSFINSVFSNAEMGIRMNKTVGTRGINYSEAVMQGWLYAGSPTAYLESEKSLEKIKASINDGYFEKLIQKYFIDNKHSSLVVLSPNAGLEEKSAAKTKSILASYKKSLSTAAIDKLLQKTKNFKDWQNAPESKEALDSIPTLSLSDIDTNIEVTPTIKKDINGVTVLHHPLYTDKLAYINMYFDSSTVPQDKLQYLYLLSNVLGRLDTEKYSQAELMNKILNVGGLSFGPTAVQKYNDSSVYLPKFSATCVTLTDNIQTTTEVLAQIMNKTKFDNKQVLKASVSELKANLTSSIPYIPDVLSQSRLQSYLSPLGKYNDMFYLDFYNFICDLDANFDAKYDELVSTLKDVATLVFNKDSLIVGVTLDDSEYGKFEQNFSTLLNQFSNNKLDKHSYKFENTTKNEAYVLSGNVQYITQGANLSKLGQSYKGSMQLLSKILSTEYLMNEVREKGGAYGSSFSINKNGDAIFTSYRDPNLQETLATFKKSADFLRNFKADDKQMTSYILGLVNSTDQLVAPATKGAVADISYISGETPEDAKRIQREILATTAEDIKAYAGLIDAVTKENLYCVIGNNTKIEQSKELFSSVKNIIDNKTEPSVDRSKELIVKAKSTLLLQDYNNAYTEILRLPKQLQPKLISELSSFGKKVYSSDLTAVLDALNAFAKHSTLKTFSEVGQLINSSKINEGNKTYLLNELMTWGYKLILTEDVEAALTSLDVLVKKPNSENLQLAETAILNVKNQENKDYLTSQLANIKQSLAK